MRFTSGMVSRPIALSSARRAELLEFERLHARWRSTSEAALAAAWKLCWLPERSTARDLRQLLELHDRAQRCGLEALQWARDHPL